MRKIIVFNHISLDGYFVDRNSQMNWAHSAPQDQEWNAFVSQNASGSAVFLFGRVTYELMAGFWPTPMAHQNMPDVAEAMNKTPKLVFSRKLDKVTWQNASLVKGDLVTEMRRLKQESRRRLRHLWQWHHRQATGRSQFDRRVPSGLESHRPWRWTHHVRRTQKQRNAETLKVSCFLQR